MTDKPTTTLIFQHASAAERPSTMLAKAIKQEAGMTITVEDPCFGNALELVDFMKEALEFAGTAGAEHASKGFIAAREAQGRYTSIRVEHTPTTKPEPATIPSCRYAQFSL